MCIRDSFHFILYISNQVICHCGNADAIRHDNMEIQRNLIIVDYNINAVLDAVFSKMCIRDRFGILNQHDCGVGHIDAHFHNCLLYTSRCV